MMLSERDSKKTDIIISDRKIYGLSGILNQGNSCYMNSAIQALAHIYPLIKYFFEDKDKIINTIKQNARKIFKDNPKFKVGSINEIDSVLKTKIADPEYSPSMLTHEEAYVIVNSTITFQMIRLVENIWKNNYNIIPTSFRKIFTEVRNKFFLGYEQHDAEEAYSCIMQQMQEELSITGNIRFRTNKNVTNFLAFKNDITDKLKNVTDADEKKSLIESYIRKKREMPVENLIVESFREMKKYYDSCFSRITEIFSGFIHSSTYCPDTSCGYSSNKFDAFLHLSLPIPLSKIAPITIYDCFKEYCKDEILDDNNLWSCDGCNKKVKAVKKLRIWKNPMVLVIQLKRFGISHHTKDNRMIEYPITDLNIGPYISVFSDIDCYLYSLQCIINHRGGVSHGHYYTYCRDEDTDKWFNFNDDIVREISSTMVVNSNAYLLVYIRQDLIKC